MVLKLIGYLILAEARTNMRALIGTSLMNLRGTQILVPIAIWKTVCMYYMQYLKGIEETEVTLRTNVPVGSGDWKISDCFSPGTIMVCCNDVNTSLDVKKIKMDICICMGIYV